MEARHDHRGGDTEAFNFSTAAVKHQQSARVSRLAEEYPELSCYGIVTTATFGVVRGTRTPRKSRSPRSIVAQLPHRDTPIVYTEKGTRFDREAWQ